MCYPCPRVVPRALHHRRQLAAALALLALVCAGLVLLAGHLEEVGRERKRRYRDHVLTAAGHLHLAPTIRIGHGRTAHDQMRMGYMLDRANLIEGGRAWPL